MKKIAISRRIIEIRKCKRSKANKEQEKNTVAIILGDENDKCEINEKKWNALTENEDFRCIWE